MSEFDDYEAAPKDHRKVSLSTLWRTNCSICRLGIYSGQPTVWTRGQHLGFSHATCAADLCGLCGKYCEGLHRTGSQVCKPCVDVTAAQMKLAAALTLERFGPMEDLLRERFTRAERTRA